MSTEEGRHFAAPAPDDPTDAAPVENAVSDCPDCAWTVDTTSRQHPAVQVGLHRRQVHGVQGQGKHGAKTRGRKVPRAGDSAPTSQVNINLSPKPGGKKRDPALDAVQARAEWLAGMVAVAMLMAGQPDDATDIERGKGKWAESVRELATHEEWLRKLGQGGGEQSDRVLAWVKFLAATLGLSLPILLRHQAVPPAIARVLAMAAPPSGVEGAPAETVEAEPADVAVAA